MSNARTVVANFRPRTHREHRPFTFGAHGDDIKAYNNPVSNYYISRAKWWAAQAGKTNA